MDDSEFKKVLKEKIQLYLTEAILRKKAVVNGSLKWKLKSSKPGHKIYHGREVEMDSDEQSRRSKAAEVVGNKDSVVNKRNRRIVIE